MSYKVVREDFESIHHMLNIFESRPNNSVMRNEHSSQNDDYGFTKTHSYKEAVELFAKGYTDILPKIKSGIKKIEKKIDADLINVKKIRPNINIEGFTPHVPNAILNLPNSMININRHSQKQKTLDIIYMMGGNCGEDAQLWVDAGVVLLTAIKILEVNRISVRLKVGFMFDVDNYEGDDGEVSFPTVLVKNYGQRADLQKLCFPLAHPSMFRRFGFKWLETNPNITSDCWPHGYGYACEDDVGSRWDNCVKALDLPSNEKIIRAQDIRKMRFELKPLLDKLLKR